ncbi:uncharacterized protein LOC122512698 [Leptopilina heterotoma]|uniref:uncharacterized protein LOC122512698 n=1 Tax=Leptopilina heterotoma TaxID=63436 RepID=UPI001CA8928A|nr:uncharacterized protein LOC122512698 [Leptopilina heterotoma]
MAEKKLNTNTTGNSSVPSEVTNNFPSKSQFSSTTRLTSFLAPRDLTLGGNSLKLDKPKKVYTPNLNAQRKKKEDGEPEVVQKNPKNAKNKHQKGKGKGRGGDKDHDWKKKDNSKYIQSSGVFAEGFADSPRSRARFSGYREAGDRCSTQELLQRPKLNAGRIVDKEQEEEKLKLLLRDDFIDNDDENGEFDNQNCPIVLPIITSEGKLFKEEVKIEANEQIDDNVGDEKKKTAFVKHDKKKNVGKELFRKNVKDEKKIPLNISQSLENKANGYFLIRFTDCLPGESVDNDDEDNTRPRKNAEAKVDNNKQQQKPENIFDNLKEGFLGKLQILKSGSARLCLGNHNLSIDLAPQVFFREDVVVSKLDNENITGELINLGPVHTNLICTPDWESLIKLQV